MVKIKVVVKKKKGWAAVYKNGIVQKIHLF